MKGLFRNRKLLMGASLFLTMIVIGVGVVFNLAYAAQAADDTSPPSLDIRFNPSGTHVDAQGNLKIRLDFYPGPEDKSYSEYHVEIADVNSAEYLAGYHGELDKNGEPVDPADYEKWYESLPKVWVTNPVLCHFLTIDPDITVEELDARIKTLFTDTVTATIDDAMTQENSAHLISPLMRDKSVTTGIKVSENEDKNALISSVNSRLSGFSIDGQGKGEAEEVEPQSIDVGPGATDRSGRQDNGTFIDITNPANADGTLDTWETWFAIDAGVGVKAATFVSAGGSDFYCRDFETIGSVPVGSKQTFTGLDIDVATGDYAGTYFSDGTIERNTSGGTGLYSKSGDQTDGGTDTYALDSTWSISIYGTGTDNTSASISNTPSYYEFGSVSENSTYSTGLA